MCFMAVGMAEVARCDVTVQEGQTLKKGDQLGMFRFGGSTHCLIFRPETIIVFENEKYPAGENIPLYSPMGRVVKPVSV